MPACKECNKKFDDYLDASEDACSDLCSECTSGVDRKRRGASNLKDNPKVGFHMPDESKLEDSFDFSVKETSVRKAIVFSIFAGIVSAILYSSEVMFHTWDDELVFVFGYGLVMGAMSFIVGLTIFKAQNLYGWLLLPISYISAMLLISGRVSFFTTIFVSVGSMLLFVLFLFVVGLVLEWVKHGE